MSEAVIRKQFVYTSEGRKLVHPETSAGAIPDLYAALAAFFAEQDVGCQCRTKFVGLGVKIAETVEGRADVRLLELENDIPQATGEIIHDVVMVQAASKNAIDLAGLIGKARINKPMNEVVIV